MPLPNRLALALDKGAVTHCWEKTTLLNASVGHRTEREIAAEEIDDRLTMTEVIGVQATLSVLSMIFRVLPQTLCDRYEETCQ